MLLCETKGAPAELQQATTDQRHLLQVPYAAHFHSFSPLHPSCVPLRHPLWCSTDRRCVLVLPLRRPEVLGKWHSILSGFIFVTFNVYSTFNHLFFFRSFFQASDILGELCVLMLVEKSKVPHTLWSLSEHLRGVVCMFFPHYIRYDTAQWKVIDHRVVQQSDVH